MRYRFAMRSGPARTRRAETFAFAFRFLFTFRLSRRSALQTGGEQFPGALPHLVADHRSADHPRDLVDATAFIEMSYRGHRATSTDGLVDVKVHRGARGDVRKM